MRSIYIALLLTVSHPAQAEDLWGCEVLLCLANPAGPMAVGQCVPPITKLWKALFKFKPDPFPTCLFASPPGSAGNYAVPEYKLYDDCPSNLTPLPPNQSAVLGSLGQLTEQNNSPDNGPLTYAARYRGIGDGSNDPYQNQSELSAKICVGTFLGNAMFSSGISSSDRYVYELPVYDRLAVLQPAMRMVVNVYVDGKLYNVARP